MCPTIDVIFTTLPNLFFNILLIAYLDNKKVDVKFISITFFHSSSFILKDKLSAFIHNNAFDFSKLQSSVKQVVRNLDRVIDLNFYPAEKAATNNYDYRPLGIGVQGLIDVFQELNIPTSSVEASKLNRQIFENMYYAAVKASCELARERGYHKGFKESPAAKGKLSFDRGCKSPQRDLGRQSTNS